MFTQRIVAGELAEPFGIKVNVMARLCGEQLRHGDVFGRRFLGSFAHRFLAAELVCRIQEPLTGFFAAVVNVGLTSIQAPEVERPALQC
ncbi:hypothetical protein [Mycobacterium avium]|uniref:hypothetical protein n=1 Tax=Mycobacterium avium TaxID=1764 RepID=UPI0002EF8158|nr:hypothetical protein [Mycobacterium avium]ETA99818.1 hypothetical protein O979_16420 [Mycobacterium avium subsp. paratuberculosis 10-4404]ETB02257.1 hypothetical protein O978_16320 [Mycobacterium avium subsp. paratuberculosis 10-5864]ETB11332.1 hypothetical protein O980_12425 [Mycobacterium avium subsp. paratuberculosis 08-8281]ETB28374.1 hypothetical protein O977_20360 [Mycobacterium avium subsp. paratuberculosis 10-5975]ETB37297.1 hypothetical protein O975_17485 [Mycobacterium avium subsp